MHIYILYDIKYIGAISYNKIYKLFRKIYYS